MGTSGQSHATSSSGRLQGLRVAVIASAIIVALTGGLMGNQTINILAQTFGFVPAYEPPAPPPPEPADDPPVSGIRLSDLDIHPDRLHAGYLQANTAAADVELVPSEVAGAFKDLLSMYEYRQAVDDNFTVRAYDIESGRVLDTMVLEAERVRFSEAGGADWAIVDRKRRGLTRELVDTLVHRGLLRDDIRVRWGRRDQVREARAREANYVEHEIRLARYFGLSLLAAEIGTVETFNDDRLVSRVGARSRYQLMPAMLRARGVHHFRLRTRAGTRVDILEEWHPLITMQAAFVVARAYSNAVGHEIPGLSAYHTGPYNIFRVYREYLTSEGDRFGPSTNVVGGFLWALTTGFDRISRGTSFKGYSRGYVPTLYASLRATEDMVVDTTATVFAEQIRLREGESLFLSELLHHLDGADERVRWHPFAEGPLYERFRSLNPHFNLPPADQEGSVPAGGDVFLVATTPEEHFDVRFFLPLGATAELRSRGVEEIDYDATVRYDRNTFEITDESLNIWDQLYATLVEDVRTFGFTFENRSRLDQIVRRLEDAAAESPTLYRRTIRDVARLHERVWASSHFDRLARVVPAARGRLRLPAQPPDLVYEDDHVLQADGLVATTR